MKIKLTIGLLLLVFSMNYGMSQPPGNQQDRIVVHLCGFQENPQRFTPATGSFAITNTLGDPFNTNTELRYTLKVHNLQNVKSAHLHLGGFGTNGPIIFTILDRERTLRGPVRGVLARGTISEDELEGPLEGQSLDELRNEIASGNVYVNVHTNDGEPPVDTGPGDFPEGEIRGQLLTFDEDDD